MDSKRVISKLIKIAENQQKIIMKLAQQAGQNVPHAPATHPSVTDAIKAKLPENLRVQLFSANVSYNGLTGGAAFKIVYVATPGVQNKPSLEDGIYNAAVACQKAGGFAPVVPQGNFTIEEAQGANPRVGA